MCEEPRQDSMGPATCCGMEAGLQQSELARKFLSSGRFSVGCLSLLKVFAISTFHPSIYRMFTYRDSLSKLQYLP